MTPSAIRALVADLWRLFRWPSITLTVLLVINGFLDGAAMALLFPFLGLLGVGSGGEATAINHVIMKVCAWVGITPSLGVVALLMIGVTAVQNLAFIAQSWLAAHIQHSYVAVCRERVLSALLKANWSFYLANKSAEYTNVLVSETVRAGGAFYLVVQTAAAIVLIGVYVSLSLAASVQVTLLLLGGGGVIVLLTQGIARRSRTVGEKISLYTQELLGWVAEVFAGMKLVKATAAEDFAHRRFSLISSSLQKQYFRMSFYPNLGRSCFEMSAFVALIALLTIGVSVLAVDVAVMVVIVGMFVRLVPRLSGLQQNAHLFSSYAPAVLNIDDLTARAEAAAETIPPADQLTPVAAPSGAAVRVEAVTVSYEGRHALNRLSLEIERGTTVALVGQSGAGKTTLLDCILRLSRPDSGRILVNGQDLNHWSMNNWRQQVGYVTQETVLFNASIRDNIRWNCEAATEDDIVAAATMANAHEFIAQQPNGYDTIIGDRGVRLSGGQRQRLGLARALVGRKSLLILDEATSALDSISEVAVMDAIKTLHKRLTIIIVAHRLSTVRHADVIHVMKNGEVAESGSWDALFAANGTFAKLWRMQEHSGHRGEAQ